jgi:hypothetical protein
LCVLDASRTSGERRATIIVGEAMRGAACVAASLLVFYIARIVAMDIPSQAAVP